ncbi:hypothetical protein EVG20_g6015 [Dentipellis fragilis]|uniref:Uncharacterized protein n=1 Tax=Dentipellis fragilis TaxID=205917 RepID=A0A4Y9YNS9_9AGAM|nr:hypothetical protein EVG20_g6015 [Dentipellis fragilis]
MRFDCNRQAVKYKHRIRASSVRGRKDRALATKAASGSIYKQSQPLAGRSKSVRRSVQGPASQDPGDPRVPRNVHIARLPRLVVPDTSIARDASPRLSVYHKSPFSFLFSALSDPHIQSRLHARGRHKNFALAPLRIARTQTFLSMHQHQHPAPLTVTLEPQDFLCGLTSPVHIHYT